MDVERIFGSKQQTKLVCYLLANPTKIFSQASLARFLSCSPSTVARVLEPLIKEGIIAYEQISGQMKIIALNHESDRVKTLLTFYEGTKRL